MLIGRHQYGFTYIGLLLFIAVAGIALSVIGPVWHTEAQREKEKELLFVGEQYARAIRSYLDSSPGDVKQYPASLEDLLEDKRFPVMRRHLRKLYPDPMTGHADWGLVKQQNRIVAVYSLSKSKPFKQDGFPEYLAAFAHAGSYQEWQFTSSTIGNGAGMLAATGLGTVSIPDTSADAVLDTPAKASPHHPDANPRRQRNAICTQGLVVAMDQCNATCGVASGDACMACYDAAINQYSACKQGN